MSRRNSQPQYAAAMPGRAVRRLASAAIALHLVMVVLGPLSVPARIGELPPQLASDLAALARPYLELALLRNGYRFFAPDPGFSSNLLRYQLEFDNTAPVEGWLPDPIAHWPRLRYHRHFMLAEQVRLAEGFAESYCRHLQRTTGASRVRLYLVRHRVPLAEEVRRGMTLSDPSLYEEELLGEYTPD